MISDNVQIAIIAALPATIVAVGGVIIPLIGMHKHRNHEKTSDDTNAQVTLFLNGGASGFDARIEEAVKRHVGERLK